jgi:hypothetical protein
VNLDKSLTGHIRFRITWTGAMVLQVEERAVYRFENDDGIQVRERIGWRDARQPDLDQLKRSASNRAFKVEIA